METTNVIGFPHGEAVDLQQAKSKWIARRWPNGAHAFLWAEFGDPEAAGAAALERLKEGALKVEVEAFGETAAGSFIF